MPVSLSTRPAGAPGGSPLPRSLHNIPLIPDTPGMRWCPMSKYSSTTQVSCPDSAQGGATESRAGCRPGGRAPLSSVPRDTRVNSAPTSGAHIDPRCDRTPDRCLCASRSREKRGCSLPAEGRCPTKPFPTCTPSLADGHAGTPHPSAHKDKCTEQLGLDQAAAKLQTGKTSTTSWSQGGNDVSPTGPEAAGAQLCPPQPWLCVVHSRLDTRPFLEMTRPSGRKRFSPENITSAGQGSPLRVREMPVPTKEGSLEEEEAESLQPAAGLDLQPASS